jgi:hypothetical protein
MEQRPWELHLGEASVVEGSQPSLLSGGPSGEGTLAQARVSVDSVAEMVQSTAACVK